MAGNIVEVALGQLRAHPLNSNVMAEELVVKLAGLMGRSGRYPPLVVRGLPIAECRFPIADLKAGENGEPEQGASPQSAIGNRKSPILFQVLDGHHRWKALERLGRTHANCIVWDVTDAEALLLLSTLNRLQGKDDPRKRAALLGDLAAAMKRTAGELARWLPENVEQVGKYLELQRERGRVPGVREARGMGEMPVAVHFFLSGAERVALESRLAAIGGGREAALMKLVEEANDQ